jgi:RHS repeat-associated protein
MTTDANGQVLQRYDYLPFGEPWPATPVQSETQRFGGHEFDTETQLNYFGARHQLPQTGRFTQADQPGLDQTLFDPQSWNLYAYVRNNPLKFIDPDGRACVNGFNAESGAFCAGVTAVFPQNDPVSMMLMLARWADFERASNSVLDIVLNQQVVNFSAGLGDALLLGSGPYIREGLGIDVVDQCSAAYDSGSWASFALGAARVGYAGLAKGGAALASSGVQASAFRDALKSTMRLGVGSGWRQPNLAKYGTDAALRAAAGRTNSTVNTWGALTAMAGTAGALSCGHE